jgi:hypothetical protein
MVTISKANDVVTLINVFTVELENQQTLVDISSMLRKSTKREEQ